MRSNDLKSVIVLLQGPDVCREVGLKHGLSVAQMRVLLGILRLKKAQLVSWVEVPDLVAAGLYSPTRLRAAVSKLVVAGYVARSRSRGRHLLTITATGRQVVDSAIYQLRRVARDFVFS